jgi:uncharacterized membrane protein
MKWSSVSARLISYFVRGLLLLGPVYFTGYIIYSLVQWVDDQFYVYFPGSGLLVALLVVVVVGFIGSTFIAIPVFHVFEQLISRLPFVNILYSSLKDLISAFVGDKKKFNQPVLIRVEPESNLLRLGFITQDDLSDLALPDAVAVYVPQSYAFAGDLFIVPRSQVTLLDARAADVMKFIVSGGVSKNEPSS